MRASYDGPMRRRLASALILVSLAVGAAGCSSAQTRELRDELNATTSSRPNRPSKPTTSTRPTKPGEGPDTTDGPSADDPVPPIEWEGSGRIQEAYYEVPLDYDDPDGDTITLYLARRPASNSKKRIGTLLVNPGGPGFGGSPLAYNADFIYGKDLLDRFDILAWDPRGTGLSSPAIDCIDDDEYDRYFAEPDITPDTPEAKQALEDLAESFARSCTERNARAIQFIGTNNTARDMDRIRRALGEDTISYFGFSYGSELGATWATLFPDTVRAAVLDGAADPTGDLFESGRLQTLGFEDALDAFLEDCRDDTRCAFHSDGDPVGAFDALMEQLDANPVPTRRGRPDANRGVALGAVVNALYNELYWPQLAQALDDARDGDGSALLDLFDDYYQRQSDGSYTNDLEAFQTIVCMDTADRPTVAEDDADTRELHQIAPRMTPSENGSYFCTFFPTSTDPRVEITGAGAGPILVVGTTGDAATPLEGSRTMAHTLEDGVLLVVVADQHTGYDANQCSRSTIEQYLIDPVKNVPDDETTCG